MEEVILVFVKDYDDDGEYHVWGVYSKYSSEQGIDKDIQEAKKARMISNDAEYYIERWNVYNA